MYGMHPWPYIYIYTYILYIHRSYHVYLYILHIYPNFIAFRWFRWAIFAAKFWYFKVASNWSTDPQAWRMFNSRPRRTLAAWKFDGCDVFFFPCRMTFLPENSWKMRHVRLDVTIFEVCHFSSWSGWIVSISDMPFSQLIGWKTWF